MWQRRRGCLNGPRGTWNLTQFRSFLHRHSLLAHLNLYTCLDQMDHRNGCLVPVPIIGLEILCYHNFGVAKWMMQVKSQSHLFILTYIRTGRSPGELWLKINDTIYDHPLPVPSAGSSDPDTADTRSSSQPWSSTHQWRRETWSGIIMEGRLKISIQLTFLSTLSTTFGFVTKGLTEMRKASKFQLTLVTPDLLMRH